MKVYLAADHRGYALKEEIKNWLSEWGYEYEDMGAYLHDPADDYPDFVIPAAKEVARDPENRRGIIVGFNGQGEAIAVNRITGVRAAVYYGEPKFLSESGKQRKPHNMLVLAREDDNTNVLSLAAGFLSDEDAKGAIKMWLEARFTGEERHVRRLNKIDENR